jgi:hypothetical protein
MSAPQALQVIACIFVGVCLLALIFPKGTNQ